MREVGGSNPLLCAFFHILNPSCLSYLKVGEGGHLEEGGGLDPPTIDPPIGRFGVRKGPGTGQLEGGGLIFRQQG